MIQQKDSKTGFKIEIRHMVNDLHDLRDSR
jgi:hypothetical protein